MMLLCVCAATLVAAPAYAYQTLVFVNHVDDRESSKTGEAGVFDPCVAVALDLYRRSI